MNLTRHFTLNEFTRSATANRLGIENKPNAEELENLFNLARTLERIRSILGDSPMIISSAFRNAELNRAVGGVPNSDHAKGLAADFTCPSYGSVYKTCNTIAESGIKFDQVIYEQSNSKWVHFGVGPRMRQQALSWKPGVGYVNGIVIL